MPPRQLPTVARQGLEFLLKNLSKPPIYPQVAIKFVLKHVKWWGIYNIIGQMIPTVAHPIWKRKLTSIQIKPVFINACPLLLSTAKVQNLSLWV